MKLSELKNHLTQLAEVTFLLPNGDMLPKHYHITEAGLTTKHYIDCGGTIRKEEVISFQLWVADDFDHRLSVNKLSNIIQLAEPIWENKDLEIEVEYQSESISRHGLEFNGSSFLLINKFTDCLAKDKCGIPTEKIKTNLRELNSMQSTSCTPGAGCC
ncbi:MAG: DUF6428 family protein [Bacteroidota bacterium]